MTSKISFINREEELKFFLSILPPISPINSILIIRSPSGYGKSSLLDKLIENVGCNSSVQFVVVEPSLRGRQSDYNVYNGFYIQQIAINLNNSVEKFKNTSLNQYLQKIKWKTIKDKKLLHLLKEYPSVKTLYTVILDYIQRAASIGDFSSKSILESNASHAIEVCRQYIDEILNSDQQIIVLIREAQHIDEESLKFLLQNQRKKQDYSLIFEYTSDNKKFFESHAKIFDRNLDDSKNVHIHDLVKLNQYHLQQLLNQYVDESLVISSDSYCKWDGNLRAIREMKYQVYINQKLENIDLINDNGFDLDILFEKHLKAIPNEMKIFLLIVLENKEGISFDILKKIIRSINSNITKNQLKLILKELIYKHNYLIENDGLLRLDNEDISNALKKSQSYTSLRRLVQAKLREYYLENTSSKSTNQSALSTDTRRALELCITTKDTTSVIKIIESLSKVIAESNDQSTYIEIIYEAITSNNFMIDEERIVLITWVAALAYEVGNYSRASVLLNKLQQLKPYQAILMSCSLLECGEHDRAIEIANQQVNTPLYLDYKDLVFVLYLRFSNQTNESKKLLFDVIHRETAQTVLGYAYRFTEMVLEFPDCIPYLEKSIKIFSQKNLKKSEAYSRLACAVHMVRSGNMEPAKTHIEIAQQLLKNEISDKHIFLNNKSVVSLFDSNIDYLIIEKWLETALLSSEDDFSDTTILNNLAITKFYLGHKQEAERTIKRALEILKAPDFNDKDIFWATYYNAIQILLENNDKIEAGKLTELALKVLPRPSSYPDYWDYRFLLTKNIDNKYSTMVSYQLHPLFLSHWQIDYEGILLMKEELV